MNKLRGRLVVNLASVQGRTVPKGQAMLFDFRRPVILRREPGDLLHVFGIGRILGATFSANKIQSLVKQDIEAALAYA